MRPKAFVFSSNVARVSQKVDTPDLVVEVFIEREAQAQAI